MIKNLTLLTLVMAIMLLTFGSNLHTTYAQTANPNLIANPSAEQVINDTWQSVKWGNNISNNSIQVSGVKDGKYFLRARTTSYSSGDTRWQFKPVVIKPNTKYDINFIFKSSAFGAVMANYQDSTGKMYWDYLGATGINKSWSSYKTTYVTKPNAVNLTYFVALTGVGSIDTDSYSLKESVVSPGPTTTPEPTPTDPTKFNRGMVSLEFDDGWLSVYQNALPIINNLGIKATQYIVTDFITPEYLSEYMSPAQMQDWRAQGHFIGSHTTNHSDLQTFDPVQIDLQLKNSKIYLSNLLNEQIQGFVTPYCNSSAAVEAAAKLYYKYSRDCDTTGNDYLIAKNTINPYHLTSKIVEKGTTTVQINQWLTEAQTQKKWLILVYHRIDNTGGTWSTTVPDFQNHMNAVKHHGIAIVPTMQAFDEAMGQVGK